MKISCSSVSSPSNQIRLAAEDGNKDGALAPLNTMLSSKSTIATASPGEMVNNNHILNNFGAAGTGNPSTFSSTTSNTSTDFTNRPIPNGDLFSSETTSTSHAASAAVDIMIPTKCTTLGYKSPFPMLRSSASIGNTKHSQFAATSSYKGSIVQVSPSYVNDANNSYNLRKDDINLSLLEDNLTTCFPHSSNSLGDGGDNLSSTIARSTSKIRNQAGGSYVNEQPSLARKWAYEENRHMIFQESNSSSNYPHGDTFVPQTPLFFSPSYDGTASLTSTVASSTCRSAIKRIAPAGSAPSNCSLIQDNYCGQEMKQIKKELDLIRRRGNILKRALITQMGHLPDLEA